MSPQSSIDGNRAVNEFFLQSMNYLLANNGPNPGIFIAALTVAFQAASRALKSSSFNQL